MSKGDLQWNLAKTRAELKAAQDRRLFHAQLEITLPRCLDDLMVSDEIYRRQRSRAEWLQAGDCNTVFFHQVSSQRRQQNLISYLERDDGVRVSSKADLQLTALRFFQK